MQELSTLVHLPSFKIDVTAIGATAAADTIPTVIAVPPSAYACSLSFARPSVS